MLIFSLAPSHTRCLLLDPDPYAATVCYQLSEDTTGTYCGRLVACVQSCETTKLVLYHSRDSY